MALVLGDTTLPGLVDVVRPFHGVAVQRHLNVLVHERVRRHRLPVHHDVLVVQLDVLAGSHGANGTQAVGPVRSGVVGDLGHLDHLPGEVVGERGGQYLVLIEAGLHMLLDLADERSQFVG